MAPVGLSWTVWWFLASKALATNSKAQKYVPLAGIAVEQN